MQRLLKGMASSVKTGFDTGAMFVQDDIARYATRKIYQKGGIGARAAKLAGTEVSADAVNLGKKAAIIGAVGGTSIGAMSNQNEGFPNIMGGSVSGAGLGAVGGGAAGVAFAIAKGIR